MASVMIIAWAGVRCVVAIHCELASREESHARAARVTRPASSIECYVCRPAGSAPLWAGTRARSHRMNTECKFLYTSGKRHRTSRKAPSSESQSGSGRRERDVQRALLCAVRPHACRGTCAHPPDRICWDSSSAAIARSLACDLLARHRRQAASKQNMHAR